MILNILLAQILLIPVSGVYTVNFRAPPDLDVIRVCIYRVDATPRLDLGCLAVTPNLETSLEVALAVTPGDDAEIRGFAYDATGNESAESNEATADFTAPGPPALQ